MNLDSSGECPIERLFYRSGRKQLCLALALPWCSMITTMRATPDSEERMRCVMYSPGTYLQAVHAGEGLRSKLHWC